MGGGNTTRTETKRSAPRPTRKESQGAEAGGGSAESLPDFCELKQQIAFEASASADLFVGMRVRLLPQHLPLVVAGGETLGFVVEPDATAMRHCIEEGFSMAGWISSLSPGGRGGVLSIKGKGTS